MNNNFKKYGVLLIDDEKNTLLAFEEYFENDFNVIIAKNSIEADNILNNKEIELGIIISDHKMPDGLSGLDFLRKCHERHPDIVKILTTGYSNHNLSIEAVNSGILYKYVVKPWNMETMRLSLMRAMEFYILKKERDSLLQERIGILKQLIFTDRIRSIATLTEGLSGHLRNSNHAFKSFIRFLPADSDSDIFFTDKNIVNLARQKNNTFLELIRSIRETVVSENRNFEISALDELIESAKNEILEEYDDVIINYDQTFMRYKIKADIKMIRSVFMLLIQFLIELDYREVNIKVIESDSINIKISFSGDLKQNDIERDIWKLLPVFFGIFHHSGKIEIFQNSNIEILLPFDPDNVEIEYKNDNELRDSFFNSFEALKHYEIWLDTL